MRKTMALAGVAGVALTGAASGQTMDIIDLSGVGVDGGAPTVIEFFQERGGPLVDIGFDLGVLHNGASWGSETRIVIEHESGFMLTADGSDDNFADTGPDDVIFGWGDDSGQFFFTDQIDLRGQLDDTQGLWTITFFDEFDDGPNPDHQYLDGSRIIIKKIPAPASAALLGLGGLVAARRRR